MGTTLTAMLWSGDRAALIHIGDSRAFRLRDGQFRRITEDHVMSKLVSNAGELGEFIVRFLDAARTAPPTLACVTSGPATATVVLGRPEPDRERSGHP